MPWHAGRRADDEAAEGLIEEKISREEPLNAGAKKLSASSFPSFLVIIISTNLFWAILCAYLWTTRHQSGSSDFIPSPITKTIRFDDLLRYNTSTFQVWREMDPSLPRYFGPPAPEVDAAWTELLRPEYPAVTESEMKDLPFSEEDRHPSTGQFHVALDVFHNLHCLNMVRKEIDKDYYGDMHMAKRDEAGRTHLDHCMNHIRQALQCRPDFSPAAMHVYTDETGGQFTLGNAEYHSCYDWNRVMKWADDRRRNSLGFWEDHDN